MVLLIVSIPIWAAGPHRHPPSAGGSAEPGYLFALGTANRFLHAWQTDDLETATILLGERVRHSQDPEKFEQSFSGTADRAFEIARGQGNSMRYRFPIVLVTRSGTRARRRFSEIVVVNTGKNDWVVDKLP